MKHINTRTMRNAVLNVKADGKHGYLRKKIKYGGLKLTKN